MDWVQIYFIFFLILTNWRFACKLKDLSDFCAFLLAQFIELPFIGRIFGWW
jgi:hypothetical protein